MSVRERRLAAEQVNMEKLSRQSTLIDFVAEGDPPDTYLVTFRCRGMIDPIHWGSEHLAKMYLHAEFPKLPPQVTFLTPNFHPNIAALIQMADVQQRIQQALASAPDEEARKRLLEEIYKNKDLFTAHVCLDALLHNWTPKITLAMICIELGEMIQYKRYNAGHPLNIEAAKWAEENEDNLPVDPRPFLDLEGLEDIRILSETPLRASPELEIHLLGEESING